MVNIIDKQPMIVNDWIHKSQDNFMGQFNRKIEYGLGLTPGDGRFLNTYYFNIAVFCTMFNVTTNRRVFYSFTTNMWRVYIDEGETPSEKMFFGLIKEASDDFKKEFYNRCKRTDLEHTAATIAEPVYSDLEVPIRDALGIWNNGLRKMRL